MQIKKLHVLCWALMYVYIVIAYLLSLSDVISMMLGLSLTLVQMLQFYFCYCLVFPQYLQKRKWWILFMGFFIAMILFIALRYGLEEIIYPLLFNISNFGTSISLGDYVVDNLYYGSAVICISALVYSVEQNYSMQGIISK